MGIYARILSQSGISWWYLLGGVNLIFVTLGSQKFQFNRLLQALDDLIDKNVLKEKVFAQTGYSDYAPKHFDYKDFLSRDEFIKCEEKADYIITHGGTGAIIGAVKKGKRVIAVPRLAKYGEHVDDHQLQLISQFADMKLIIPVYEMENLFYAYLEAKDMPILEYKSNTKRYILDIEEFINKQN